MAEKITANIGFEKKIWDAACVLRGNMDASEYKSVVLGLIFLKYISDRFDEKYKALLAEGDGFEEDVDEYTSEGIFFVPANARWSEIAKKAHTPEIGTVIDEAMRSIEKENKRLKDILPKNFARPELDKRRLGEVVDLFTNIQMIEQGSEKDILGRTYEYCLSKFAEQEGKLAGEFYTPSCVVRTLVEVLQPYHGRVYDPCCGSGGMFVQSAKFIENHSGNINDISVYGQDSNPTTWKMAQMNLAIRGIDADLGKNSADTFFNDCHPTLRADYIMANPPFNLSNWGADKLIDDVRWKYGVPPASNANYAWIQHMIHHLAPNGKIGLVLANTALSTEMSEEYEIRKNIIEDNLVEAIISLPAQLFYTTKIKASIWIINKNKTSSDILFIETKNMGQMLSRTMKEFSDDEINRIAELYNKFCSNELLVRSGEIYKIATITEVRNKKYNLSPSKFVVNTLDGEMGGDYIGELEKARSVVQASKLNILNIPTIKEIRETANSDFDSLFSVVNNLSAEKALYLFNESELVNNERKVLERQINDFSENLFVHWFVDHEFPVEDGKPYFSSGGKIISTPYGDVPSEWRVVEMGSILTPYNERVGEMKNIPEYSTTNQGILPRAEKFNKSLSKNSAKNKIVRKGNIVFGMSREIFNFGVMKDEIGSVSPAYHVYTINNEYVLPDFLEIYMRICSEYFMSLIKPGAREGQVLDKEELKQKLVLCPPLELQAKYLIIKNNFGHWLI